MSPSRFLPGPDFSPTEVLGVRAGPMPFPPSSVNLRSFRIFSRESFVFPVTCPDAATWIALTVPAVAFCVVDVALGAGGYTLVSGKP
jgi:hypothetical protein